MLVACPVALVAFVRFEARLSARGGDPLVAFPVLRTVRSRRPRDGSGVLHAVLVLSDLRGLSAERTAQTPMDAGIATVPFATGFFVSSLVSSPVMQRLGVRALTLGFALQDSRLRHVMLAVSSRSPNGLEARPRRRWRWVRDRDAVGHQGGNRQRRSAPCRPRLRDDDLHLSDRRRARRRCHRRRLLLRTLGTAQTIGAYAHAFTLALGCNIALLALAALLSLWLSADQSTTARAMPAPKSL